MSKVVVKTNTIEEKNKKCNTAFYVFQRAI